VARVVLTPGVSLRQGIIAIPAETSSDLGRALSAHAITVTPGEMVVEMDEEGTMYTHCLDATAAAETAVAHQRQRRAMLERILGAKDDG
jgi:multicomponent Na+:H+ antiporter subunit E